MRRAITAAQVVAALAIAATASAQIIDWPTERPPAPLAARQVNFPPYQVRTLGNLVTKLIG